VAQGKNTDDFGGLTQRGKGKKKKKKNRTERTGKLRKFL